MLKKLDKYRKKNDRHFERVLLQISRDFYMFPEKSFEFVALKPFYLTVVRHLCDYNRNAHKSLSISKIEDYTKKINMTYKKWYTIYSHIKSKYRNKS